MRSKRDPTPSTGDGRKYGIQRVYDRGLVFSSVRGKLQFCLPSVCMIPKGCDTANSGNSSVRIIDRLDIRYLFWGSSLQHPQTLLGCARTSRIQSLTFKPVLADPASWWMEEEGSGAQSGGSSSLHQLAGSAKTGLKVRDWMQDVLTQPCNV